MLEDAEASSVTRSLCGYTLGYESIGGQAEIRRPMRLTIRNYSGNMLV